MNVPASTATYHRPLEISSIGSTFSMRLRLIEQMGPNVGNVLGEVDSGTAAAIRIKLPVWPSSLPHAVIRWKYTPAPAQAIEKVTFNFNPK